MAQANISVTESQFRCPICLDILRDPVSIPCGHTYCMVCISNYWDQVDSGQFGCPQCRDVFSLRPVLGEAGEVPCDFCPTESKLRAGRSCLVCLASFCDVHVVPHREVGPLRRHKLVDAVERLAERLCAQHRLGLEPVGSGSDAEAEWSGACFLCRADQEEEERGADTLKARRQLQLQESQRTVQRRIRTGERYLEELQQNLESLKVLSSAVLEESDALFAEIAHRLEKTKAEVGALLEAKGRVAAGRLERDIGLLETDLEELRRRDEEIGQLLRTEDKIWLTQAAALLCVPVSADRPSGTSSLAPEAFSDARRALSHLRSCIEDVCREEVDRIGRAGNENCVPARELVSGGQSNRVWNAKPQRSQSVGQQNSRAVPVSFPLSTLCLEPPDQRMRAALLRFSCRLSLDVNTAYPTLFLLEEPQGAHCGEDTQPYPPHPHRFDSVAQVLCREGLFGAASYWEVEWQGGGWVDIGVTSLSIGRKGGGKPCLLGRNESSWRLRCTHKGYTAWHDNRKTTVAAPPCQRIGVLLERQKGSLSFYSMSDTVVLLHTFQCQLSEPLYPAFRFDLDSTLLICPHPEANANANASDI